MSIQDDCFDIRAGLEKRNKALVPTFDRFAKWAFEQEDELEKAGKLIEALETTVKFVGRHPKP